MIIKNLDELLSHGNTEGRRIVLDIIETALAAPDPYENTKKVVRLEGNTLIIGNPEFSEPVGQEPVVYNLDEINNVYIVGGGKSVQKIALALEEILGDLITEGQINIKKGDELICKRINVTLAGHPMPDEESVKGAARMLEIEKSAGKGDIVFYVTSGGGSSLKALPAPGISLEDLRTIYQILYFGCGASMPEANAVRNLLTIVRMKHAKYVKDATLVKLEATELPLKLHGHVFFDRSFDGEYERAIYVLKKYGIWDIVPASVREFLERADPQYLNPSPEEFAQRPYLPFRVMGPEYLLNAAEARARELRLNTAVLATSLNDVEAQPTGEIFASIAREAEAMGRPLKPPCVFICGGEVVVRTDGETGTGGRNQELVLAASSRIANSESIVIGSVDSDGTDGPTDVAGGIADGFTTARIRQAGFELDVEMKHHNSHIVLGALGDTIDTGNTGNNVRDLRIIYVGKS
jgi:glycerate 2-kinase